MGLGLLGVLGYVILVFSCCGDLGFPVLLRFLWVGGCRGLIWCLLVFLCWVGGRRFLGLLLLGLDLNLALGGGVVVWCVVSDCDFVLSGEFGRAVAGLGFDVFLAFQFCDFRGLVWCFGVAYVWVVVV